jgi:hypothetical protein
LRLDRASQILLKSSVVEIVQATGSSVRLIYQPDGSDAGSMAGVKANDRFDHFTAGDHRPAWSEPCRIQPEFACANLRSATDQFVAEVLVSACCLQLPGNPEQIAPMAVG